MPITEAFSESLQAYPFYTWAVLGIVVLGIVSFGLLSFISAPYGRHPVSYTHLRAHETGSGISYAVFCL